MTAEEQQRLIENWPWKENRKNGRFLDVNGNPIIQARPIKLPDGSWAVWCSTARIGEHVRVKTRSGATYFGEVTEVVSKYGNPLPLKPSEMIVRVKRIWSGPPEQIRGHANER